MARQSLVKNSLLPVPGPSLKYPGDIDCQRREKPQGEKCPKTILNVKTFFCVHNKIKLFLWFTQNNVFIFFFHEIQNKNQHYIHAIK